MDYKILYQEEALEKAFRRAMNGHRDDPEHAWYEANKIEALDTIQRKLACRSYELKPLRTFWVSEPKRRQVQAPSVADKIVQNALVDEILYDAVTKPFIRDSYSCVIGRGTDDGLDRLKQFMAEAWRRYGTDCSVLKADIHHFFASIDQDDVLRRAERYISDSDVMELVRKYVRLTSNCHGLTIRSRRYTGAVGMAGTWTTSILSTLTGTTSAKCGGNLRPISPQSDCLSTKRRRFSR